MSCGIKSILTYLLTYICDLRHIRPVLDFDSARTIGISFVQSRLAYCNSMLSSSNTAKSPSIHLARAVVATQKSPVLTIFSDC